VSVRVKALLLVTTLVFEKGYQLVKAKGPKLDKM
jgi:hypothetical protein